MTFRFLLLLALLSPAIAAERPQLVLQITVDQLRGDMLPRYRERFTGGFKRLLDEGLFYTNAHYSTANTFTAAGHSVLATGSYTPAHGMVANEWWDRESGAIMYCTADASAPVIGEPAKPGAGMSPKNLLTETFGDRIVAAGLGRAFAIAGKDRSSIIPGGHKGRAFWFSEKTGGFTSSTYYGQTLPAWLANWNATKPADAWRNQPWTPLRAPASYRFVSFGANEHARPNATLGRAFPHPLVAKSDAIFYAAFRYTPFFDELTARCAQELVTAEKLGQPGATDYLSISFSGHDYIGHCYGPDSMEYEDSLLRLDAVLGKLFAFLDETVGRDRVLVVLSADHGVDDIPEAVRARGLAAGRIHPDKLKDGANAALRAQLSVEQDLVTAFVPPGFYFDRAKLASSKVDAAKAESALADYLRSVPGIAAAFTHTELAAGSEAREFAPFTRRGFHPERSGDVVVVQARNWYMYPEPEAYAAMHGSPYECDTFVPLIFAGAGLSAREIARAVDPASVAATLAAVLKLAPRSAVESVALTEVLEAR